MRQQISREEVLKVIHATPWWQGDIGHVASNQEPRRLVSNIPKVYSSL